MRDDFVNIGQIIKPHGLNGELKANLEINLLPNITDIFIYIEEKPLKIINISTMNKGVLLEIEGINSLEMAENLRGKQICIKRSQMAVLPVNEFLIEDLINLQVYDKDELIGQVIDFEYIPNNPLLKIELNNKSKFLLPFNFDKFIEQIDLKENKIFIKDWKWLI